MTYQGLERSIGEFVRVGRPERISRRTFQSMSGTMAARTLAGFAALKLRGEDGQPTPRLVTLVDAWDRGRLGHALAAALSEDHAKLMDPQVLAKASWENYAAIAREEFPDFAAGRGRDVPFLIEVALAAGLQVSHSILFGVRPRQGEPQSDVVDEGVVGTETQGDAGQPTSPTDVSEPCPVDGRGGAASVRQKPARNPWTPSRALQALMTHVYDPEAMPLGSGTERDLMKLVATLKRMGA